MGRDFGVVACAVLCLAASDFARAQSPTPLIPRTSFFGNPSKAAGRISPDGNWLSWEAPANGVLNVFMAPIGDPTHPRQVTDEKARPVAGYGWSSDSKLVLYATDNGGDENYQLYGVDVASGVRRQLTHFTKTRVSVLKASYSIRDRVLISANNRDPKYFDVLSLDLKSGTLTPVFQNNAGFGEFVADETLALRLALRTEPSGDTSLYRIVDGKAETKPFETIPYEDAATTGPIYYSYDGKTVYWIDSRGRDTSVLIAQDVATGAKTVLASDPRVDLGETLADPQTGRVQAYGVNYEKLEWTAIDPAIADDLAFLKKNLSGVFSITSRDWADDKWTIGVSAGDVPGTAWLYDRKARTLTKLFTTRPELDGVPLAPMHPVEIKSRDGLTLVSYLTLPVGSAPDGETKPHHPVPLVLWVHGGPWARDYFGYNAYHQSFANRGYAVLSVNFRSSTGFGKRFTEAGDREWGAKMLDDLIDAKNWAVSHGVAIPDKVAIAGGSYGGYATLAGLAFAPNEFACGVDLFGPSNLNTLLKSTPAYWASFAAVMYRRMGNPTTAEGQALLKSRSPLFAADAIKRPLLIGQGVNDVRVNKAESDQIVAALQAKNIPVTYVVFADEGHGFAHPENNLAFAATSEQFLAKCLGGRAEPIGAAFKGSTASVEAGADEIPGLREALAVR